MGKVVASIGAEEWPNVPLKCMIVDNCMIQLIQATKEFDVVLADNMFGNIFSDLAGAISSSLGMLPSASLSAVNINGNRRALYEPVHGSKPDIAGQGIANPIGSILSFALALELSFHCLEEAKPLRKAVSKALKFGTLTPDILGRTRDAVSTIKITNALLTELERLQKE